MTSSALPPIPPSAFHDTTGVTAQSVTVGNISTQLAGLFTGAVVGTQAYAAYVNSQGGVNGRKLIVQGADDQFAGATNKQATEYALQNDFAIVGSVSLEDSFGGTVIAANPQLPDVAGSLDPATRKLPNNFSPTPTADGWPLGPLTYFRQRFPSEVLHTATIIADLPPTIRTWSSEKAAMTHLGYHVILEPALPPTQTDFTQQVVAMKEAGVQILFLEQEPQNYASAIFRDLAQQNFHPIVVLGTPSYSEQLVAHSGGAGAVDGAYLAQASALFLGEDAGAIPAVTTFNTWVQKVSPGFPTDFATLVGWLCAELFADALRTAGAHPTRGSVLRALRHVTAFSSGNLIPVSNPAAKAPITCYLLGRVAGGAFERLDDPPVSGSTHGFRCDQPYYSSGSPAG
jgi:branched-chain amino acid transport system substrate-binding protein